jgi:predicted SAM-dependent methyltransferase
MMPAALSAEPGAARLNIGCGEYRLSNAHGWVNLDEAQESQADLKFHVPPLPWPDNTLGEIYAGHFLEHLSQLDGRHFLAECYRVLVPGGQLGIVVPDTREVARRYLLGEPAPFQWPDGWHDLRDLDELCWAVLFSTLQPSQHQWAYDLTTLRRALERAGFEVLDEIDRYADPRLSTPQWYQCGLDARKP